MTRLTTTLALALTLTILGRPAAAATLEIHFTGLNLVYDGLNLYDAVSPAGGNQDPTEADPLTAVDFLLDGTLVGSLTSDIYADAALFGAGNIPVGGGTVLSPFGGFDLLTSGGGWGIGLNLDAVSLTYAGGQIIGQAMASSIAGQSLPFGLHAFAPVAISFVADVTNVSDNGTSLTGFDAAGSGSVSAVPEPASLTLMATGAALVARRRVRGRRSTARHA